MTRWTLSSFAVIAIAGLTTGWYTIQLQRYTLDGLPPHDLDSSLLALSALPTGLLLAASAIRRRSVAMQVTVAVVAVAVGLGRVSVIQSELSTPWGHGTGMWSGLAWGCGVVAAGVLLLAAVVALVGEWVGRRRAANPDACPAARPSSADT